ncbi:MAG: LysR substrate-binding domain-containing protein [Geminicoccaceae bacterium]|nr:LysR substrate-binding domain-containing protein [Geminicoccaceae bacterium]
MLALDGAELTARRYWARTPRMPKIVFLTSSLEAVRSTGAAGTGVTILSATVSRPRLLEGLWLDMRDPAEPVPTTDAGLVRRRSVELGAAARALRDVSSRASSYPFNAAGQSLADR